MTHELIPGTHAYEVLDTTKTPFNEWVQERRKSIGGTDAAALCGHNPWKSVTTLYYEKVTRDVAAPEASTSSAAYFGQILEPVVAAEFTRETKLPTTKVNALLRTDAYPWAHATLDYWVLGHAGLAPTSFLECKTTAWHRGRDWVARQLPPYVLCQVAHYLAVTGFKTAHVACLIGGQSFVTFEVTPSQAFVDELMELEREFWEYVVNDEPPPDPFVAKDLVNPRGFDSKELMNVVVLDDNVAAMAAELLDATRIIARAKDRVAELSAALRDAMYGGHAGLHNGDTLLEWRGPRGQRRLVLRGTILGVELE